MDARTPAHDIHPTGESSDTIEFLKRLRPAGPWVFTTIVPDGRTFTCTFIAAIECDARDFVAERNVKENVHYTVNPTKTSVNKKPSKADIDRVEYLHVDADPDRGETPEQFKARFLPKVEQFAHPPTFIIDSGNGIHLLWRLDKPVKLTSQAEIADIEARNYGLAKQFGADPVTRNVDRILRAPGTTNHPNVKKRKDGRTSIPSTLIKFNDVSTPLNAFPPHPEAKSPQSPRKNRGRDRDKKRTGLPQDAVTLLHLASEAGYASRSELLFAFLTRAIRAGADDAMIEQACVDPKYAGNAIHAHCQENGGGHYVRRQLEQAHEKPRKAQYFERDGGTFWKKPDDNIVQLANFTARIVEDVKVDDGSAQVRRQFNIDYSINDRKGKAKISADQFESLNWVTRELGADACITPGTQIRGHLANAIKLMAPDSRVRGTVYAHLGWREIDGQWLYLHADGAIGAKGPVEGIRVELDGELSRFALPTGSIEDPRGALGASLRMLDMAPRRITWPLFAATYLAPLGEFVPITVSLFFTGGTGTRKSAMQAIAQGHWYWEHDGKKLPANWTSTANSLEALAFRAKDALLVIDDFCPKGTSADVQRYHHTAERLFRAQANHTGRGRMNADSSLRTEMPPRGLLAASGEDTPSGHSLRARKMICEISPGDVDLPVLSEMQRAADRGRAESGDGGLCQVRRRTGQEFIQAAR
jgi:hypothetical protein